MNRVNEIKNMLLQHYEKYPFMEFQDVLKLLYQNEFGCGHLISDVSGNYEMFCEEWERVEKGVQTTAAESIGNGYVRMHISALKDQQVEPLAVHQVFVESAKIQGGTQEGFYRKTEILREMIEEGQFSCSWIEVKEFLKQWEAAGYPAFRHTQNYRDAYDPAYRVVAESHIRLISILSAIEVIRQEKGSAIIAIEGRCGAGKTTLSNLLARLLGAEIIHMDEFFLPPILRTKERLQEAGGNIHYERFQQEVIDPVKKGGIFEYQVFDCSIMDYSHNVTVKEVPIIIMEGVYSMHPKFGEVYDYKIFCDITQQEQEKRIKRRNGIEGYRQFEQRWIPMEELYFRECHIVKKCDFYLESLALDIPVA